MQTAVKNNVVDAEVPDDLLYTDERTWIKVEDDTVLFGITHHAQEELGQVVFLELPEEANRFEVGDEIATIESVKTATDINCPVTGKVVEINSRLERRPEFLNKDPYGHGWIARIRFADPMELDDLMSPEEYTTFLQEEE